MREHYRPADRKPPWNESEPPVPWFVYWYFLLFGLACFLVGFWLGSTR